jgi:hypothetical protein
MEDNKRKAGRPKAPPRTGPLVLGDDGALVKVAMEIAADTAAELAQYATWVEQSSRLTAAEAASTTVQFALRELFRRDRVWQQRRRGREPQGAVATSAHGTAPTVASTAPPPQRPASLPPPVSPATTRVGPERSI